MNPLLLDDLCEQVSALFGLNEVDALGVGFPAVIGGVEVELICAGWAQERVQVVLEVGALAPGQREACFMKALQTQGQAMLAIWAHFVLDPVNDRLMWCVNLPMGPGAQAQAVADLIRQLVEQVHAWRVGAFAGHLSVAQPSAALAS
jgi:hypothetical protein